MDKVREEFEKWLRSTTDFDTFRTNYAMTKPEDQQYMCHRTNLAWFAWTASSESIVVNLPEHCKGNALTVSELKEQLDKEGIKYDF
ncbi:MAG: hypothetical protein ACRC6V_13225 [Bacteroidales bacterium]